jgi:hypothetical protein
VDSVVAPMLHDYALLQVVVSPEKHCHKIEKHTIAIDFPVKI